MNSRRRGVWIFFMREIKAVPPDDVFASPDLPAGPSPRAAWTPMILYFLATQKHKQIVRHKAHPSWRAARGGRKKPPLEFLKTSLIPPFLARFSG